MGGHEHQHVLGQVKTTEGNRTRSSCAQEYPHDMCMRILHGLLLEGRERERATVVHSVMMTEELKDDQSEKKVIQVLRRCHENLGHPSQARFLAMLKNARATERCLHLARGLSYCPTCDASRREKSHHVARHDRAEEFNSQVYMGTFEVELPWRKMKILNVVDEATRYQMCVPLWKGFDFDVSKVRVAYRRYWKRWAGVPVKAVTDGGPEFGEEFSVALQQDGTLHEVTAAHAPWQIWSV